MSKGLHGSIGRCLAGLCLLLLSGVANAAIINLVFTIDPSNLDAVRREGPVTGPWAVGDVINAEFNFGKYYLEITDDGANEEYLLPFVGAYDGFTIAGGPGVHTIGSPSASYRDPYGVIRDLSFREIRPTGCCAHFGGMNWYDFVGPGETINVAAFLVSFTIEWAEDSVGYLQANYFGIGNMTPGSIVVRDLCEPFPGGGSTEGCFPGPGPFPAPEPGTLALLGLGIAGLALARRRNCIEGRRQ